MFQKRITPERATNPKRFLLVPQICGDWCEVKDDSSYPLNTRKIRLTTSRSFDGIERSSNVTPNRLYGIPRSYLGIPSLYGMSRSFHAIPRRFYGIQRRSMEYNEAIMEHQEASM